MKNHSEAELRNLRQVFGEDLQFDAEGNPIEKGVGSKSQPLVFPTSKPSSAPKPEQIDFLRKMVAAAGNVDLAREFETFLKWREANPNQTVLNIPIELLISNPASTSPINSQKVAAFRAKLRAGDIAPPICVEARSDDFYLVREGHHRAEAARLEGRQTIRAEIKTSR
jgi:hypothetical protein